MKTPAYALVLALLPSLALISCAQEEEMEMSAATDMEALTAAIGEANATFTEALKSGDAAAIAALYADDAVRLPPDEPMVRGRAAIEQGFNEFFAGTSARDLTLTTVDVGASGDLAYEIGTFTFQGETEAGAAERQGKYVVVWKRAADGTWKMQVDIWNDTPPAE